MTSCSAKILPQSRKDFPKYINQGGYIRLEILGGLGIKSRMQDHLRIEKDEKRAYGQYFPKIDVTVNI